LVKGERVLYPIASTLLFLVTWQILGSLSPSYLFPTPLRVLEAYKKLLVEENLLTNIMITLYRTLVGFAIGIALGFGVGFLTLYSRVLKASIYPFISFIAVTPSFAFIPLLMIWIGLNDALAVVAIIICVGFPIAYSFVSASKNIDPEIIDAALTLGADRKRLIDEIVLPLSLTHVASMLKLEAGHSWRLAFVTEYLALSSGLGSLMMKAYSTIRTGEIIALIITIGFLALFFQVFIEFIEARITGKWGYTGVKPWSL